MTPEQKESNDEENKTLLLRINTLLQQAHSLMMCIPLEDDITDFPQTQAVHTNLLSLATLLDVRTTASVELPERTPQVSPIELFAAASSVDTLVSGRALFNDLSEATQLYYRMLADRLNSILKKRSLLEDLLEQVQ